jgi:hypothetical protein
MTPNDIVKPDETFRKVHSGRYADKPETNTPDLLSPNRKVDVFAGKASLADKLRQRRKAVEAGDATGGQDSEGDY